MVLPAAATASLGVRLRVFPPRGGPHASSVALVSSVVSAFRMIGWLVVAAMVTTATLTVAPGTVRACSCLARDLSEYADEISVAFVGTQLEKVVYDYVDDNRAVLLFSVDRVYAGEAGPLIEVRSHAQEMTCGIDVRGWGPVGIAAYDWRGTLSVDLCGSIVAAAELESVFGEGRPPDESIRLPASLDPAEDFSNSSVPPGEGQLAVSGNDRTGTDQSLLVISLVAAAAAAVTGTVIVWRRRR